jgi:hypothetical protein
MAVVHNSLFADWWVALFLTWVNPPDHALWYDNTRTSEQMTVNIHETGFWGSVSRQFPVRGILAILEHRLSKQNIGCARP